MAALSESFILIPQLIFLSIIDYKEIKCGFKAAFFLYKAVGPILRPYGTFPYFLRLVAWQQDAGILT